MKLFIKTGNAAFADGNKQYEIGRILDEVAEKIGGGASSDFTLRDINGNTVGKFVFDQFDSEPGPGAFVLSFETDNAAFEENGVDWEAARIIAAAAEKARNGDLNFKLRDINGNSVGEAKDVEPENEAVAEVDGDAVAEATPLAKAFSNLIQHCGEEAEFFRRDSDESNGSDIAIALEALGEYLKFLEPKLTREFKDIRPDVAGKLVAENATSLDDDELQRVFGSTVLPVFNIKHMQRARVAGLTIEEIPGKMAQKNEPGL